MFHFFKMSLTTSASGVFCWYFFCIFAIRETRKYKFLIQKKVHISLVLKKGQMCSTLDLGTFCCFVNSVLPGFS